MRVKKLELGYNVIYLTGAPASGKSSLSKELKKAISPLFVFEYGKELTRYIRKRVQGTDQQKLRAMSSSIITTADVNAVDNLLLRRVSTERKKAHVIIDTHAVTKEKYGYRVMPFRLDQIASLSPTFIVCLYADSSTVRSRIKSDAQGRPQITDFEADFHAFLQGVVAVTYGISEGVPVYFLDTAKPRELLVQWFLSKLPQN